uniref:peroxiredoxin family protein n=1 Tax=Sandarakinorhabdus limnophila TaxID=210512 RepID=UPI0026EE3FC4
HLPGYVEHAETFLRNGVDEVVCVSVNDAFVMAAWGKSAHADGNGDFTKALGLTFDGSAYGLGIRGQRFSMIVRDGKVAELNIEPPGAFGVSSAEHLLGQLA